MAQETFAFPPRQGSGMKVPSAPGAQARAFLSKALHGGLPFCRPNGRQCGCATGQLSGDSEPGELAGSGLARWTAATARRASRRYGGRHTAAGALEPTGPVTMVPRPSDRRSSDAACVLAIPRQFRPAPLSQRCSPARARLTRRSGRTVDSERNGGRSLRNAVPRLGSVGFEGSGRKALRRPRLLAR